MARLELFVVSESVSVDQQTNRLSLFNVIEQVASTKFPSVLPAAVAVSMWMADAGDDVRDFQCTLRFTLPNGKQHEFASNFKFRARRHRVIQRVEGFPLNEPGMLRFEVLLNGEYVASHEVDVSKIDAKDQETPPDKKTVPQEKS
jgi:hypothetical protein